jgi:hypothetical protein
VRCTMRLTAQALRGRGAWREARRDRLGGKEEQGRAWVRLGRVGPAGWAVLAKAVR